MDIELFSRMIGDLYREAGEANGWERLFTELSKRLNFDSTSIMLLDAQTGATGQSWAINHPQEWDEDFLEYYAHLDPWGPAILLKPQLQFFACDDLYPDEKFVKSEYYYDGIRPLGIRWASGCYLNDPATNQTLAIANYRGHSGESFDKDALHTLSLFAPHIQNALTIFKRANESNSAAAGLKAIADINNFAAFIVDENLKLLVSNGLAEQMLQTGTARLINQHLSFSSLELSKAASQLIKGMQKFSKGEVKNVCRFARVGKTIDGYQLRVEPILLDSNFLGEQEMGTLLLLKPNHQEIRLHHAGLKYLFGLTETESEVVRLLCLGSSAPGIAVTMKIKESTVRTHIKASYQKLGVTKQSELVATVLSSLAMG